MNNDETFDTELTIPLSQRQADAEAVRRAADKARSLVATGHIFTHAWINEALDLDGKPATTAAFERWAMRRMRLVNDWITLLLERGVHLENSRARGYEVINPRHTARIAESISTREVKKTLEQAADKIKLTSAEGLTSEEVAQRHNSLARIGAIWFMLEKQRPRPPRPGVLREVNAEPSEQPEGE